MKAVIFDIDGTLSDPTHRLHHVKSKPYNWPAFFDAMGDDGCHKPIAWLAQTLSRHVSIIVISGRPDSHRQQTRDWLIRHGIPFDMLLMRKADDYRQDYIVKSEILDYILSEGYEILFTVDDRQQVVDMWRERGLTCLQARKDDGAHHRQQFGLLTLMIGPSGAGKTSWLASDASREFGISPHHVVSSDLVRADLCDDWKDQSKNDEVFEALHAVVLARISHGLPCVVDATNLKRKDRLGIVGLTREGSPVRYIVVDRPMDEKRATGGWRLSLPFDLLAKHDQTFRSQIKEILRGDGLPNVTVIDLRRGQ